MRPYLLLISILLFAGSAVAQAPVRPGDEAEAYTKVRKARDVARRLGNPTAVQQFVTQAETFLKAYPKSARNDVILLWLGDLLRESDPRRALGYYRTSRRPEASRRAEDLAFRFGPAPLLDVEGWVGTATDPTEPRNKVTLLFFFSPTHPQTRRVLARVDELRKRYEARGFRPIGVAAVVDDHRNQTPAKIRTWLQQRGYAFPVAIDKQTPGGASRSLARYRGNLVPWGAFLDRYGRINWVGSLQLEGNALRQCEAKIRALLDEPDYETLAKGARRGGVRAITQLGALKTPRAVTELFNARTDATAEKIDPVLTKLLPEGFGVEDRDRWRKEWKRYRYSFERDRMTR